METQQILTLVYGVGGLLVMLGIMWGYLKYNYISKTVGWSFINSMGRVKLMPQRNDIVLRLKMPSGKEAYTISKTDKVIEYYLQGDKEEKKMVLYDERAVDRLNGIPILNVSPLSILPLDRNTGLYVNIPSEIIEKIVTDKTKDAEDIGKREKLMKYLIIGLIASVILVIVGLSYINQTNTELQAQLMQCVIQLSKEATVITG